MPVVLLTRLKKEKKVLEAACLGPEGQRHCSSKGGSWSKLSPSSTALQLWC